MGSSATRARRGGWRWRFAHHHGLLGCDFLFERAHLLDGGLGLDAWEHGRDFADLLAGFKTVRDERVETNALDRLRHAELRPDLPR